MKISSGDNWNQQYFTTMSAMDIDSDISTVLATLRLETESEDIHSLLIQLEDYYERKLWHQLTLELERFYYTTPEVDSNLKFKIYELFISQFASNLNTIKVVDFLLNSYGQSQEKTIDKLIELRKNSIQGLKHEYNVKSDEDKDYLKYIENNDSIIYLNLQISRFYLKLGDYSKAETIIEKLSPKFDSTSNIIFNQKVNSIYYLTKFEFYKYTKNYNRYYSNGLLYLSSAESLNEEEKLQLCYDLCLATLLGDKIYNFGELIMLDILNSIKNNQEYNWLYELVINLNSGNLSNFNNCLKVGYTKCPMLTQYDLFLKQKIMIMSLLELVSLQSTTNKTLKFSQISEFTGAPINDVEHLIIKCFSLNLIKGSINQIDQILLVSWLQPRILNLDQVKVLYNHLTHWDTQVDKLAKEVYKSGGTIWAGV